jgi:hypothetical protein
MRHIFDCATDVLGEDYWSGEAGKPGDGLVEMYLGQMDSISQVELPAMFKSRTSTCRYLITTTAFGL